MDELDQDIRRQEEEYAQELTLVQAEQQSFLAEAIEGVREFFKESGETLSEDEEEKLLSGDEPEKPKFPIMAVTAAVIVDVVGAATELSVVALIFAKILAFVCAVFLFFWVLGKLSGGWWKKRMIKWLWIRYIAAMAAEFAITTIPATTIFILMAHYREKKIVKLFDSALERLKGAV